MYLRIMALKLEVKSSALGDFFLFLKLFNKVAVNVGQSYQGNNSSQLGQVHNLV